MLLKPCVCIGVSKIMGFSVGFNIESVARSPLGNCDGLLGNNTMAVSVHLCTEFIIFNMLDQSLICACSYTISAGFSTYYHPLQTDPMVSDK